MHYIFNSINVALGFRLQFWRLAQHLNELVDPLNLNLHLVSFALWLIQIRHPLVD
jgi:hypothetical protein